MSTHFPLDHDTRDTDNKLGCDLLGLVGNRYRHITTQKVYQVVGIDWMGETDLWGVRHAEVLPNGELCKVAIVRSFDNFFGEANNSERRYTPVSNAAVEADAFKLTKDELRGAAEDSGFKRID